MQRILITSDTEGNKKEFDDLLEKANFSLLTNVIIAGDIVGKGGYNIELLEFCFDNRNKIDLILGNKDYIVQQLIKGKRNSNLKWVNKLAKKLAKNKQLEEYFMDNFNDYLKLFKGKYIVTHAPIKGNKKISSYAKVELIGLKKGKGDIYAKKGKILIHGHTPKYDGPEIILNTKNIITSICIDTGMGKGHKLSGVILEDDKMSFI